MIDNRKEQERAELHRAIWNIANDLRGSVDGWDFKQYVLGMLFYRYISENLSAYINRDERAAGDAAFSYAALADKEAEQARDDLVKTNEHLLDLWKRVRLMDDTVLELITKQGYSITLDESIFTQAEDDEIILCLNYDGLYGINNINRFLQQSNASPAISWNGIQEYKIGDPILFNESERFAPLIYNNTKGRIIGVKVLTDQHKIQFDIELDKVINGMDARYYDFELLEDSPNQKSVIRFLVNETRSTDEENDDNASSVVPFQVAYAVSIHKAQGLEYESVKIVITDEIDELITHNIFYTAITRARSKLKIYWTPEVENKVLGTIKPKVNAKDVALLSLIIDS